MNGIIVLQHFSFALISFKVLALFLRVLPEPDEQVFELIDPQLLDVTHRHARVLYDGREEVAPMRFLASLYISFFLNEERPRKTTMICFAISMSSHSSMSSRFSRWSRARSMISMRSSMKPLL